MLIDLLTAVIGLNYYNFDGLVNNFGAADYNLLAADCNLLAALNNRDPLTKVVVVGYDSISETNL